ncbi:MAG TPA: ribose-5-phosphate isomerase [Mycobacteriales bacterium]|jgi:ribose 5-phosphate isomerase B|nr:ribose-5-phosphate isomerase [Mycobacteriales bacterium]
MRVYLGSDHAGFELKAYLMEHLAKNGHEPVDCGAGSYDAEDDYPPFCFETGRRVLADPGSLGVVIGGSGNGEQIAANKVPGIRAALAWSEETAKLGREHNDAQVVAIGARMHTQDQAATLVDTFLATPFSQGERHRRRIRLVAEFEVSTGRPPRQTALGLD